MHEKLAEDAFRATMKGNNKTAKVSDTDAEFELECKVMDTKINNLCHDNIRLTEICAHHGLDTRTNREKNAANQQQQGEPQRRETQRAGGGHQRTTRSSRAEAARQTDNTEATPPDEENELATKL